MKQTKEQTKAKKVVKEPATKEIATKEAVKKVATKEVTKAKEVAKEREDEMIYDSYEMSYSNVGGKEQKKIKAIEIKNDKGKIKTIEDGKEQIKELTPSEIKDILGSHGCDAFLASGLPCMHPARFMMIGGGQYCGYHK
jgi:hypothetical protein